jgi:tetratricopeptide (TPR) repeat protein
VTEPIVPLDTDEIPRRRLDSWKEIAAWFGRDVRTVRRWEKDEALPIHRHLHKKLGTVYAFEDELEAWRQQRRSREDDGAAKPEVPHRRSLRPVWIAAAALLLLASAIVLTWRRAPAPIPFDERDWVLITQFENRTGEGLFDGSVEYALERELVNSRFINVVPRERVLDALTLMKKPPGTAIDRETGREICLRDGAIRTLIGGRVEKLGSTYVISSDLIEPVTGVVLRSFSEEAGSEDETVRAIARLSDRVRAGFGEELSARRSALRLQSAPQRSLERVTTPSLRALQLYSQGDALIREHELSEAAAVLREAVREDAEFASAHVLLAHALSNLGRDGEARPHFEKAMELAEFTTDRERLFIMASCYERFHRDQEKAIETLETLLRLYPDHYWASSNLGLAYQVQNRPRDAFPYIVRRADLRPNNFDHQLSAAHALAVWSDLDRAETYAERARLLLEADGEPMRAWRAAWLRLYPAHSKWAKGRLSEALEEVNRVAAEIESSPSEMRAPLQWETGAFYLTLGREREARSMFETMKGAPDNLALIALGLGDDPAMKQQLQIAPASHRSAILFARAGLNSEAERAATHPERSRRAYAPFLPGVWDAVAAGELALAGGDRQGAIAHLEAVLPKLRSWPTAYYFLGVEALSRAWEGEGDAERSLAVLDAAANHGISSVFWGPAPLFWMKNELRRADLHRAAGRDEAAREIEQRLGRLLHEADRESMIVRELERRGAGVAKE